MDLLATAKATTYGGIWSAHTGQRANNSRGTYHVDHRRNIPSSGVKLLRLNSTGEVSSDENCHSLATSTSVITSKPQGTASGKIMGYLNSLMPLVGKVKQFQKSQIQHTALNSPDSVSTLVNVFSSQQKDMMVDRKTFEIYFANDGSKSNIISKAMNSPISPSQTQSLVLNSFNNHILKTSCKREVDMSSPWNKFYANWKESNNPDFTMGWKNNLCGENLTGSYKQLEQILPISGEEKSLFVKNVDKSMLSVYIAKQTESNDRKIRTKSGCTNPVMTMSDTVKDKVHPINMQSTSIPVDPTFIIPCTEHTFVQTDKNVNTDSQNVINIPHSCDKTDKTKKSCVLNVGEMDFSACNLDTTNQNWALRLDSDRCSKKSRRNKMSAKRQRRLKARMRQNCSNFSSQSESPNSDCVENKINPSATDSDKSSPSASPDNGQKSAANPVSFTLGISEFDNASSHKAYRVSMVVDCEESAFSEDDYDGDFDSCDFSYRCDFLPNGGDLFNPLNFTVSITSISMSPSTPEPNVPLSPQFQTNSNLKDINECWKSSMCSPICKSKSSKKVSFAPEKELTVVHPMVMWGYAYRSARRGPWEEYARDRQRFQRRVVETEVLLSSIFQPNHRSISFRRQAANCES